MLERTFRIEFCCSVVLLLVGLTAAAAQEPGGIDWNRARELRQRMLQGGSLTPEERDYVERAIQWRRKQKPQPAPPAEIAPPLGLKPLTDLAGDEHYLGQDGGLYGGGDNQPPAAHRQAALAAAALVQPRDAAGRPASDGKIALVSIGMSNTTQEFSAFMQLAAADADRSPRLVIVDGAQGGMDARAWSEPGNTERPGARDPWPVLEQRLQQAGVSAAQVQVAWVKQARIAPGTIGRFPKHADEMKGHMIRILQRLKQRFPNLQIAYLSSRIYAGYARTNLNPEPFAYESAFVVRQLIQDQIGGEPELNYDPAAGEVKSPLLLWGPYLWAEGTRGRRIDDLVWEREDLAADGTHPSERGRRKVAQLLLDFLKTEPTAKTWYKRPDPGQQAP